MKTNFTPLALATLALQLLGCPPSEKSSDAKPKSNTPSPATACSSEGKSCEFAPGKLGTCVAKIDCDATKGSCFTCQSQH